MQTVVGANAVRSVQVYNRVNRINSPSRGTVAFHGGSKAGNPAAIIEISKEGYEKYQQYLKGISSGAVQNAEGNAKYKQKAIPVQASVPKPIATYVPLREQWQQPEILNSAGQGDILHTLSNSQTKGQVAEVLKPIVEKMAEAATSVVLGNAHDMQGLSEKYAQMHGKLVEAAQNTAGKDSLPGASRLLGNMIRVSSVLRDSLVALSNDKGGVEYQRIIAKVTGKLFEFLNYSNQVLLAEKA